MIAYLWDAGEFSGVNLGQDNAVAAVVECVAGGDATSGRLELARLDLDDALEPSWERAGDGWTATLGRDGTVDWEPFGGMVLIAPGDDSPGESAAETPAVAAEVPAPASPAATGRSSQRPPRRPAGTPTRQWSRLGAGRSPR